MKKNGKKVVSIEKWEDLVDRQAKERRELLRAALAANEWVLPPAARALGIATSTLQYMVERDVDLQAERLKKRPTMSKYFTGRPAA